MMTFANNYETFDIYLFSVISSHPGQANIFPAKFGIEKGVDNWLCIPVRQFLSYITPYMMSQLSSLDL